MLAFSFVGMEKQEIKIVDFQRNKRSDARKRELEEWLSRDMARPRNVFARSVAVLTKDAFENKILPR
ncbi:MAG: hypothetical protein ACLUDU_06165 [Butyricimonas faecihominis]